jgi:hypothetical protein
MINIMVNCRDDIAATCCFLQSLNGNFESKRHIGLLAPLAFIHRDFRNHRRTCTVSCGDRAG